MPLLPSVTSLYKRRSLFKELRIIENGFRGDGLQRPFMNIGNMLVFDVGTKMANNDPFAVQDQCHTRISFNCLRLDFQ